MQNGPVNVAMPQGLKKASMAACTNTVTTMASTVSAAIFQLTVL